MSDPALLRKPVVHSLKAGEPVPCDGRIYRDSNGVLSFSLHYQAPLKERHTIRLERIAAFDKRNPK